MKDSMSPKAIVVWTWPRTRSTLLERFFLQHPYVEVKHELLTDAFYFGPERVSPRHSAEKCATKFPQFSGATFETQWAQSTCPPAGKKLCFAKDMAKTIFLPRKHAQTAAARPEPDNPTLLSRDQLLAKGITHVFLIRELDATMPSFERLITQEFGDGFLNHDEISVRECRLLYDYIAQSLPESERPLVIDSEDILRHSESLVRLLCQIGGIHFRQDMMTWEKDDPKAVATFGRWEGANFWHLDALSSQGVRPLAASSPLTKPQEPISEEVRQAIEQYRPDYEFLAARAHTFQ